jgi:hypothetical protein
VIVVPVSLREARAFVAAHHRHNEPPRGWLFGAGLEVGGELVAVGIVGRPNGRGLQDGRTVEVTRVCTLGTRNASSRLYGALCRAAAALGYRRAVTYTLASEPGTSLLAAGFRRVAELDPRGSWASDGRPRYDADLWGRSSLNVARVRWERAL